MSARPRWRGIARALGAWPSSIRIGFDGLAPEHRVLLAAPLYPGAEQAAEDRRARLAADVERAARWLA